MSHGFSGGVTKGRSASASAPVGLGAKMISVSVCGCAPSPSGMIISRPNAIASGTARILFRRFSGPPLFLGPLYPIPRLHPSVLPQLGPGAPGVHKECSSRVVTNLILTRIFARQSRMQKFWAKRFPPSNFFCASMRLKWKGSGMSKPQSLRLLRKLRCPRPRLAAPVFSRDISVTRIGITIPSLTAPYKLIVANGKKSPPISSPWSRATHHENQRAAWGVPPYIFPYLSAPELLQLKRENSGFRHLLAHPLESTTFARKLL